ncbi:MAG: ATP-binding protein [Spirochaetota bacterium]
MQIAIASGKGGTGKTTISTALAYYSSRFQPTALLDCDVEEPDANLLLKINVENTYPVNVLIPQVDMDVCTGCGKCQKACQYNAMVLIKAKPLLLPELCHSCGGCYLACPERAIKEVSRPIGNIEIGNNNNLFYAAGILNIGEHIATPLIDEVKKEHRHASVRIIDAPPGSSCSVIHAMEHSDFVILVAEPTPFGLHDVSLAYHVAKSLSIQCGIVINNMVEEYEPLLTFIHNENIPLLATIPHDINIAKSTTHDNLIDYLISHYSQHIQKIYEFCTNRVLL